MSFGRLRRLLATSGFRHSALAALLFAVAALAVFGAMYWAATSFMARQADDSVEAQVVSLLEDDRPAGAAELAEMVKERQTSPGTREFLYLLEDGHGRRLAGTLPEMVPVPGWQTLPLAGKWAQDDDSHALRAFGKILPGGMFLLVGRDIYELDEVADFMEQAFGIGFVATLVLAISGGLLAGAGFLGRLDAITRTSRQIMAGDLSQRIPLGRGNDDFTRLAVVVNAMLDRIQALMEGMGQVTNDIAHDMRTPLFHLRQRLERARSGTKTSAEYEAAIDGALADMDRVLDTFSALLRIAQISSGRRRAGFVATDLTEIVRTIAETYMPVAEDSGRTLSATIARDVTVEGDRHLLTQMLANLMENALKHTPPGTAIGLELAAAAPEGGPAVVVTDTGPGIPETERANVFRRFYRLDASRSTPGSGLGLSLVAAVAELHGAVARLDDNGPGVRAGIYWRRPQGVPVDAAPQA